MYCAFFAADPLLPLVLFFFFWGGALTLLPPPFRFNRFLPDQSLWSCEVTEYKSACVDEWDMCRANGVAVIRAFRYLLLVPGEGGYLLLVYL